MNTASVETAGLGAAAAVAGFVINYLWRWLTRKDERTDAENARSDKLHTHNSSIAIELLRMTQSEAAGLHQRVKDLQAQLGALPGLERQVGYLQESLLHIEALLKPSEEGGREAAEFNARAFLARMLRLREDRGILANTEQVERARRKFLEGGI